MWTCARFVGDCFWLSAGLQSFGVLPLVPAPSLSSHGNTMTLHMGHGASLLFHNHREAQIGDTQREGKVTERSFPRKRKCSAKMIKEVKMKSTISKTRGRKIVWIIVVCVFE